MYFDLVLSKLWSLFIEDEKKMYWAVQESTFIYDGSIFQSFTLHARVWRCNVRAITWEQHATTPFFYVDSVQEYSARMLPRNKNNVTQHKIYHLINIYVNQSFILNIKCSLKGCMYIVRKKNYL